MRILVSGQAGFTGRYLTNALVARGHDVMNLDADVTRADTMLAAVAAARPDRVVHLAAKAFVHSDDFTSFYAVNQLGTFNLLQALATQFPGTPVLLASTANIYGNAASGYLTEDTPPDPVSHYAMSKWAMEMGARFWTDKLPITIVRPFNYTGVGQDERYLIPKIVAHFQRREPTIELGNLDVQRDFGDVRSVCDAYCKLIENGNGGLTVNICSGAHYSIRNILTMASEITGHTLDVYVNPAFVRSNEVALLAGKPDRLQAVLPSWQPRPMKDTLAWMLGSNT